MTEFVRSRTRPASAPLQRLSKFKTTAALTVLSSAVLAQSGASDAKAGSLAANDGQVEVAQTQAGARSARRSSIEEVVVFARKREESLSDVPVAVTALSAADLENANILGGEDLFGKVPNLYFTGNLSTNSEMRFIIRGVGVRSPLEPSVAMFIDGAYMPTVGWNMDFLKVERLEVLRGPQGALFGRNTQAGAINIITRQPEEQFGGQVRLEYDEFDTVRGDVYVAGPIADGLRFSVAALAEHTDGFVKNVTLGRDELERDKAGGRITLRADLSERLDATLYIDGVFERGGFYGDGEPLDGQPNATPNHRVVYDQAHFEDLDNYGGSLNINYDLGFAVLTSITALRKISSLAISDLDNIDTPDRDGLPPQLIPASIAGDPRFPMPSGNYTVIGREQSIISEELRLASTGDGPFQWLVGLYGYVEENDRSREQRMPDSFRLANPGNFVSGRTAQDRKGFAAFGQATYTLWERLDLTAGLRFATEKDEQTLAIEFIAGGGFVQNEFGDMPEETFSDITPMGSVTYRWNDEVMTYVTIAKGFKGGGFNLAGPARLEGNQPFDSEKSLMYELGSKLSLFDNRMTLGLALFQIDTNDMQVTTTVVIGGGQIVTNATTNAAKARSRGFELEFEAVPAEGFTLSGAVGYTDAEYVTFMPTMTLDLSGQPIEEVPDWTANLNAEYAFPVGGGHSLAFGLSYQFVGGRLMGRGLPEEPHINVESFDSVDIRATLGSETWDLTVYAKNVLDSYNIVARNIGITFFDTPGLNGTQRANPPRQVGVKGTVRF